VFPLTLVVTLRPFTHLPNEDPDQPESTRQEDHDDIANELEEPVAVFFFDYDYRIHVTSSKKIRGRGWQLDLPGFGDP
jgi:hypothetical protein